MPTCGQERGPWPSRAPAMFPHAALRKFKSQGISYTNLDFPLLLQSQKSGDRGQPPCLAPGTGAGRQGPARTESMRASPSIRPHLAWLLPFLLFVWSWWTPSLQPPPIPVYTGHAEPLGNCSFLSSSDRGGGTMNRSSPELGLRGRQPFCARNC